MNKDEIRQLARSAGIPLNETLKQKMEEAKADELLEAALPATELNKLGDQIVQKAVTLAIIGFEADAQREAEDKGLRGKEAADFVVQKMLNSSAAIQKSVKTTADVLERTILRKSVAEVTKQLKEWARVNKPRR